MIQIAKIILANVVAGFFFRAISALTPLILVPLMIRTWGLAVYGEWLLLTAIPAYIMLAPDFGVAGAVVNQMPRLALNGREAEAIRLYRSSFSLLLLSAAVLIALGFAAAVWIDWSLIGVKSINSDTSVLIICLYSLQVFCKQQLLLHSGIYKTAKKNPRLGFLQSAGEGLLFSVSIAALWLGSSPGYYVIAVTATNALVFIIIFFDCRRIKPEFTLSLHGVSLRILKPYLVPGLGHAGMPLVHALQNQGVLIVIGKVLGAESVGLFQTARVLSNGVKSVLGLLANSILIEIPALLGERQIDILRKILVRNTQAGMLLASIFICTILFFGEDIYRLWLGAEVVYMPYMVIILLLSLFPFVLGQSFTMLILASNKAHLVIVPFLLFSTLSIVAIYFGASFSGLHIVSWGIFFLEFAYALIIFAITQRHTHMRITGYFKECLFFT